MTLTRRIVVCMDVADGRVVKGKQFVALRDVGDPAELAVRAEAEGADELVLLDVSASAEGRSTLLQIVERAASRIFIPLTVGGGVRTADDVARVLRAGADKVSINSAAVLRPDVLSESAARFGAQCVVASIDARLQDGAWRVYVKGGRERTALDAVEWARQCARLGAGEILLTSIDKDGTRSGYDCALVRAVADVVGVPVVASGGGGHGDHLADAFEAGADAALVAGIVHDGVTTVRELKQVVSERGFSMRAARKVAA